MTVWENLRHELAPRTDRLAGSLRDTLSMILALVLMESLRVPGAMLGLALLFLVHRESPVHLVRTAVQIVTGCLAANLVSVCLVQVSDGSEVARVIFIVVWIFVAVCGQQASRWPVFFINTGFYGFLFLSAWDSHLPAGRIVLNNLSDLAALSLSLLCFICVDFVFRDHGPREELRVQMHARLALLNNWFDALQDRTPGWRHRLLRLRLEMIHLAYGPSDRLQELENHLANPLLSDRKFPAGLQRRIDCLRLMLACAIFMGPVDGGDPEAKSRSAWLRYLLAIDMTSERLDGDWPIGIGASNAGEVETWNVDHWLSELVATFSSYPQVVRCWRPLPVSAPIWTWNSFFNRDARLFALKTTLAAVSCYVIYSAIGWPGIVTCVTTVLFTALSTSGAMKEKQVYRFLGSLLGGLLAVTAVSLVIPNMDSIAALVLLVVPVIFGSAWILRSPRIGYVGLQISYTFFTTLVVGFSASSRIAPVRDRMAGIALGCVVMWIVFDQLWPVRSSELLGKLLDRVECLGEGIQNVTQEEAHSRMVEIANIVAQVPAIEDAVSFDFGHRAQEERSRARSTSARFHQVVERLLSSLEEHHPDQIPGSVPFSTSRTASSTS